MLISEDVIGSNDERVKCD